jgi:hypothetical protein
LGPAQSPPNLHWLTGPETPLGPAHSSPVVRPGALPSLYHPDPACPLLTLLPAYPSLDKEATDLGVRGLDRRLSPRGSFSGALERRLCRGVRHWRGLRCPGRHSLPATVPGPGSCPSDVPAVGCSFWAAAGALTPEVASPSRAHGNGHTIHGPLRSQRGGQMTPSYPHPCPPGLQTRWAGCRPSPMGLVPQCSQTRLHGELPEVCPTAERTQATSGQP